MTLDGELTRVIYSGSLSKEERLAYVRAVKCLQTKPARTPSSVAAGANSRVSGAISSRSFFVRG